MSWAEGYCPAAIRRSQWLTSVDFPTPAQATIVTTLTSLFAHARSRKAISSSRPKTSPPVMGNLAIEILSGTDPGERDSSTGFPPWVSDGETFARPRMKDTNFPNFAVGLRVTAGEAEGDIFCQFLRPVHRPAPVGP